MTVTIAKDCIVIDGKRMMLRSGELHYSRVPRDQWPDRLLRMREAGLNTVSTYFMWNWHELKEGQYDFTGKTDPQRDAVHYLDLVGESGLFLIARPGPWVCAEWLNGGYPAWLIDGHPEIMSLNSTGRVTDRLVPHAPVVSYLHPTYMKYVRKWFDSFLPLISRFSKKYPGRLLLIQADNETCYGFHTAPFDADYNTVNIGLTEKGSEGLYHAWLREKYGMISELNSYYGTSASDFGEVEPPRSQPKNKGQLLAVFDWVAFKEDVVTEFLEQIANIYCEHGIDVPASANELLDNGTQYSIYKKSRHLFDGIDMYPNSFRDMLDITTKVINPIEFLKTQQREKYPLCFEFQGGWYNAKIPLNTTHLHQRLGYAHGLKGLSYYMWVGGTNPKGWGTTGDSYDYDCAIQEDGRDGRRLPVMKRFLEFTLANEESILDSEKVAELGLSYYQPYDFWCAAVSTKAAGLNYNIASMQSRLVTFETALQTMGFNIEYFDLEHADHRVMQKYKLLVVTLYDFLDENSQRALLRYAEMGGSILIAPMIPNLGAGMQPCTILGDALGISVREGVETQSVDLKDSGELVIPRASLLKNKDGKAIPIATIKGSSQACGYLRKVGKGRIAVLGFLPSKLKDEKEMVTLSTFLSTLGVKPSTSCTNPVVNVVERISSKGSGLLYVSNLTTDDKSSGFEFPDPGKTGSKVKIKGISIARRSAIVWPINLNTRLGEIKYLTSEVTGMEDNGKDEVLIRAWGYIGTNGKVSVSEHGDKTENEVKTYFHTADIQEIQMKTKKGRIRIIVEGINPLSDLP